MNRTTRISFSIVRHTQQKRLISPIFSDVLSDDGIFDTQRGSGSPVSFVILSRRCLYARLECCRAREVCQQSLATLKVTTPSMSCGQECLPRTKGIPMTLLSGFELPRR